MNVFVMTVIVAMRVIMRHRLRAGLTMLGVIIGVGSVIAMVSIGLGASEFVQNRIASIGSNVIMIFQGHRTVRGVRQQSPTLTITDAEALISRIPALSGVAYMNSGDTQVIHEGKNWSTRVLGTTPSYLEVRDWNLARGAAFTQRDVDKATKVAILGHTVVEELFPFGVDPVGATIRINKMPFTVIGTLTPKGSSAWGNDQDDLILIPFSTAERKVLGTKQLGSVGSIFASVEEYEHLPEAVESVKAVLRERHRLEKGEDDDFYLRTQMDIAEARQGTSDAMTALLFTVASISLLVGGIGIMNTLLVSVTERTREIGIRIAVGARRRQILLQFLVESGMLSLIGGVIGIGVGIAAAKLATAVAEWPTIISPVALLVAFVFSATIGVVFGLYPAHKASRLNPIDALRYE